MRSSSARAANATQLVVAANVTVPPEFVFPPGGLKVRVRGPGGMVIDTVAIAGRPWELSAADRAASVLTIKAQGAAPPLASLQRIAVTLK